MNSEIYQGFNESMRNMYFNRDYDREQYEEDLEIIGPFANALSSAINAENNRKDKIQPGIKNFDLTKDLDQSNGLGFFNQCFPIFRGAALPIDITRKYENCIGIKNPVCLDGE